VYKFFDSNLFQTIIILIVGLFIFIIPIINKEDERKRAATILIMEIREIEEALDKLRESERSDDIYYTAPIIKENSWVKYKFMFVKLLDQDEYSLISKFYSTVCRIEEERVMSIKQISLGFETKAIALHQAIVDVAKEEHNMEREEFLNRVNRVAKKVYLNTPGFEASMPKELMYSLLKDISYITTSTAGVKIKKVAKMK